MSKSKAQAPTEKGRDDRLRVAALKYEPDKNTAPTVVAAGSGAIAQRILQVAMENGVTIYQDDTAATLLAKLETGSGDTSRVVSDRGVNIYISYHGIGAIAKIS
jgi:flagellar biosynthesis protein